MKRTREHATNEPQPKRRNTSIFDGLYAVGQNAINVIQNWWNPLPNPNEELQQHQIETNDSIPLVVDSPGLSLPEIEIQPIEIKDDIFLNVSLETNVENPAIDEERQNFLIKRLFLTQEENPGLYRDANNRLVAFEQDMVKYNATVALHAEAKVEKPKRVHPPTIQLSHDGLALMSYLYAKKDNSPKQPIVVRTFIAFKNIVKFVDDSPSDIALTLIVQFEEDYNCSFGIDVHRIALKLEKVNSELRAIYADSTISSNTSLLCNMSMGNALEENAKTHSRKKTILHQFSENQKEKSTRQNDGFQCTVFTTKDARQLNRDNDVEIFKDLKLYYSTEEWHLYYYDFPAVFLKGLQSRSYQTAALAKFGEEIVTRKGATLKEVYEKHPEQSYIPHFSKKYLKLVTDFANTHTDAELNDAIDMYSAEKLTSEQLQSVFAKKSNK